MSPSVQELFLVALFWLLPIAAVVWLFRRGRRAGDR